MIRLTITNGEPLWLVPSHVVGVSRYDGDTLVWCDGDGYEGRFHVEQTPDEVAAMIAAAIAPAAMPPGDVCGPFAAALMAIGRIGDAKESVERRGQQLRKIARVALHRAGELIPYTRPSKETP